MPLPDLLLSNPPSLSDQLRCRTNQLRSEIVRANHKTQFAQNAPELSDFCHATAGLIDQMDDNILSETFQKIVPFTTYDSYSPYIALFFEKSCKLSAITDLLAPGLPDFLCRSSSTSGGIAKIFPKYNCMEKIRSSDAISYAISDPLLRRIRANICWFSFDKVKVIDEDSCSVATFYLCSGSTTFYRVNLCLDPEKDEERMENFLLDHTTPYATGFIKKWSSFLLIHALFAISSRPLETMSMGFINTFVDMIRHLDMQFDMIVDCIANGTVPDLDGIAEVRRHLEVNISADPERAKELRDLGRPSSVSGWCGRIWPNLQSITAITSGSFTSSVPLARRFLGPNIEIHSPIYGSTEGFIGLPYSTVETNQFKLCNSDLIEFLDVRKTDSISSLTQPWEVEQGNRYEVVLTTRDGLWRYRLGDVVEILGFDPTDGVPVLQFIERRNMAMRFPLFMVTEEELMAAMSSSLPPDVLAKVVNWTTTIDNRSVPATIGYFVELACDHDQDSASSLASAPERLLDQLSRTNKKIPWAVAKEEFRKPTVRRVRCGTFSDFLQLRLDEGSDNLGQIKVPVVLPKTAYVTWFSEHVTEEF